MPLFTWFAFCCSKVIKKPLRMVFLGCCVVVCLAEEAGPLPDAEDWPAALFSIFEILFRAFWIISISCCVSHMELLIKPSEKCMNFSIAPWSILVSKLLFRGVATQKKPKKTSPKFEICGSVRFFSVFFRYFSVFFGFFFGFFRYYFGFFRSELRQEIPFIQKSCQQ